MFFSPVFAVLLAAVGCGVTPEEELATPAAERLVSAADGSVDRPSPAIVRQLAAATEGLLFLSESDYPFEVLHWERPGGAITVARVAELTGEQGKAVEQRTLEEFFHAATTVHEGQTTEELRTAERYRVLVKLLRKKLAFVRVYRFGEIEIHSYVVGVTRSGDWAGLSTIQIET